VRATLACSVTPSQQQPPPDWGSAGTVLGLDNVPLDLPIAGVGSRVLAASLDYAIQAVLQIAWLITGGLLFGFSRGRWGWGIALLVAGFFVIDWGYFAGSEIFLSQQTVGKKALKLRVVTRAGGTPDIPSLLLRNLTRMVDLLVGVPLMALDPLARRLGDRLAGTLVVHDSGVRRLALHRIPEGWRASDVAAVESLLERSAEMEPWRVERMARTVLETLQSRYPDFLQGAPGDLPPVERLRRLFDARTD
jgi:uncharacterized RDD family membrane protein YckC